MQKLRESAKHLLKHGDSECKLCGETSFAVDFYLREEATIVEIALGLPNPATEFEKYELVVVLAGRMGQSLVE